MTDSTEQARSTVTDEAARSDAAVADLEARGAYNATDDAWVGTSEPSEDARRIARCFHERYETLAPTFGYRTREASAVRWDDVPPKNKALMVATVQQLLSEGTILP